MSDPKVTQVLINDVAVTSSAVETEDGTVVTWNGLEEALQEPFKGQKPEDVIRQRLEAYHRLVQANLDRMAQFVN